MRDTIELDGQDMEIEYDNGFRRGARAEREKILKIIDKNFHRVLNRKDKKDKRHLRLQIAYPKWIKLKKELQTETKE